MLELNVEILLTFFSLFSQFQACYDFCRIKKTLKLDGIFNIDIKEDFQLIGFTYKIIDGIDQLIIKSRILHIKCKTWDN